MRTERIAGLVLSAVFWTSALSGSEVTVGVTAGKPGLGPGDTLSVEVSAFTSDETVVVDIYAALLFEDGTILMLPNCTGVENAAPLEASVTLRSNVGRTWRVSPFPLTLPDDMPVGDYAVLALATETGTMNALGDVGRDTATIAATSVHGVASPGELYVTMYDPDAVCDGTTLFATVTESGPRIVDIEMDGDIAWSYEVAADLQRYTNPGFDVELLESGNILYVLPGYGIHEIDRDGELVWSRLDTEVSHDADRLSNGNTIYIFGNNDTKDDAQVKEVTPAGDIAWSWSAKAAFGSQWADMEDGGWTHANAVTRMSDGSTLVNLRNFSLSAVVDASGAVTRTIDWAEISGLSICGPHEPEVDADGDVRIALQMQTPFHGVEVDGTTNEVEWGVHRDGLRTARDCDFLPNGNVLMTGVMTDTEESVVFEVTPAGRIVWELVVAETPTGMNPGWFYKAQRIPAE